MVNAAARVVISSLNHAEKNFRMNVKLGIRQRRSSWKDLITAPSEAPIEAPIRVRSSFLEGIVGLERPDLLMFEDIVLVSGPDSVLVDFGKSRL